MGGMNVGRVMALHAKLDHRPMRLLVHMAFRSLDPGQLRTDRDDLPCMYWDGAAIQSLAVWGLGWTPGRDRELRRMRADLVRICAIDKVGTYRQRPVFRVITGDEPSRTDAQLWIAHRRTARETGV